MNVSPAYYLVIASVAICCALTGCTQATGYARIDNPYAWVIPSPGTTYIYRIDNSVSNSSAIETHRDTEVVADTGLFKFAQPQTIEFIQGRDTSYVNYRLDGSVQLDDSDKNGTHTTLYPTGGAPETDPTVDSDNVLGTHFHESRERSFVGKEQIVLMNASYASFHIRELYFRSATDSSLTVFDSTSTTTDYWFVPRLGHYGKEHIEFLDRSTSATSGSSTNVELVEYHPR